MTTVEQVLEFAIDTLSKSMGTMSALWLALQILAWAKLSRLERITDWPSIFSIDMQELQRIEDVFAELSTSKELGIYCEIFTHIDKLPVDTQAAMRAILPVVRETTKNGALDNCRLSIYPFLSTLAMRDGSEICLPEEVISLMVNLTGKFSGQQIYCPYDNSFSFASSLATTSKVFVENQIFSAKMLAIALINDLDIEVEFGNLLYSPSYVSDSQLNQFDITLSVPPMGVKVPDDVYKNDLFNRFLEPTNSGNVLNIQHILSQTRKKAVIASTQSILFSSGAERRLREYLLKSGVVKAIIVLPSALLPYTSIPFSILVLDKTKKHETVRFIAGDNEDFYERGFRGRSLLSNWQGIIEQFNAPNDDAIAIDVTVKEILANGSDLTPSQYLLPPEVKKMKQILDKSQIALLGECVDVVKPLSNGKYKKSNSDEAGESLSIYQFGVADFPEFGYLSQPPKKTDILTDKLSKKDFSAFIQPLDIILAIKGSTGKVAIAPESVPGAGDGGWMVNQSCVILRAPKNIDPKVLFMYLRSDVSQCWLNMLVVGAGVPLIKLKPLMEQKLIIPNEREVRKIIQAFEDQVQYQAEIQQLRSLQRATDKRHWSITKPIVK